VVSFGGQQIRYWSENTRQGSVLKHKKSLDPNKIGDRLAAFPSTKRILNTKLLASRNEKEA
jgi:hypothetical protein